MEVIVIKIFLLSALLSPLISDMSCFSGKYENNEIRTMASFFFFSFFVSIYTYMYITAVSFIGFAGCLVIKTPSGF